MRDTRAKADVFGRFGGLRKHTLVRAAVEKFSAAWLACFLVMSRGDLAFAFSIDHARIAAVCGVVGAGVAVALLVQMDRTTDSSARHATISAVTTFIGDVVARPMHFSPYWAEPALTAAMSAVIAIAIWHGKRWLKSAW
jgi:hypothetical protein